MSSLLISQRGPVDTTSLNIFGECTAAIAAMPVVTIYGDLGALQVGMSGPSGERLVILFNLCGLTSRRICYLLLFLFIYEN